jgi:WD40 repeat protein
MTLASADYNRATLWDTATGRPLLAVEAGYYERALAYSPDGTRLAIGKERKFDPEGCVSVFKLEANRGVMALRGFSSQCGHVAFSHDGERLAALAHNWEVGVWNLASNRLEHLFQAPSGILADNAALAFSRDDRQLAFATSQRVVLWDLEGGTKPRRWTLPRGLAQYLCFDPAGRLLLFQWDREGADRACCVRDLFSSDYLKPLAQFPQMRGDIQAAALSSWGDFVVIVAQATNGINPVKVFDPLTGRELQGLPGAGSLDPDSLRRNPETASLDTFLPQTKDSALIALLGTGPSRRVISALSPDGRVLVTGTYQERGMTLLWTNKPARRLTLGIDHGLANWPQFSADGKLLAVGTSEGIVLVWELEETIQRLKARGLGWR